MKKLKNIPSFKISFDKELKSQILKNISDVLDSGMFTSGKFMDACEKKIADYIKAKNVVAVSSGSAALESAAFALKQIFGTGKILVPNNTFIATVLAFERQGFEVDFYQNGINKIDLLDEDLEGYRGVVVVDLGGVIPSNIRNFVKKCNKLNIWVCEDAAQAYGSRLGKQYAGTFGNIGIFSFFGTKVITSGEGGAVISKYPWVKDEVKSYRDFGKPEPWETFHFAKGWNARMSEFAAAVLLPQLNLTEKIVEDRKRISDSYYRKLEGVGGITMLPRPKREYRFCGYKVIAFINQKNAKDRFVDICATQGVKFQGSVYDRQLTDQPVYKGRIVVAGKTDIPSTRNMICLPSWYGMSEEEIDYVVKVIKYSLDNILWNCL